MDFKEITDAIVESKAAIQTKLDEMKTANDADKAELQKAIDEQTTKMETLQKQADELDAKIKMSAFRKKDEQPKSLVDAFKDLFASDEFIKAKSEGFRYGKATFELKADTSDITGDVNRSVPNMTVSFAPDRAQAFIPNCVQMFVGQDKNRVIWMDGTYTSNAGYVAEGTGAATADAGAAVEKGREMAKISAKLPLSSEMLEDAEYVASAFRMKLQDRALLFTDNEVYVGDGEDGVEDKHIYGIVGHSTAFSAVIIDKAASIPTPNIGDLVDGCILQAQLSEFNNTNIIWLNPSDFFDFRTAKDANGNYLFVKDVNGAYTINGLQVVVNTAVPANTLTVADKNLLELYWKRRPEVKFSQMDGTNFTDDMWTAVLFLRAQLVVETANKLSIINVPDIAAAIAALAVVVP